MKKLALSLVLLAWLVVAGCSSPSGTQYSQEVLNDFIVCLNDNGAQMFGDDSCPYCREQKTFFGDAFAQVDYIQCSVQQVQCEVAGITGYPTWKGTQGQELQGLQSLEDLSAAFGCELPE